MENSDNNNQRKLYIRKVPILWWTHRWVDFLFIIRELTSLCVAGYVVVFVFYVRSVIQGPEAFARFSGFLQSPLAVLCHAFALAGLIYHSITWFNLAPKAMVIKIGEYRIPDLLIAMMNYAGWALVSITIFWLVLNN